MIPIAILAQDRFRARDDEDRPQYVLVYGRRARPARQAFQRSALLVELAESSDTGLTSHALVKSTNGQHFWNAFARGLTIREALRKLNELARERRWRCLYHFIRSTTKEEGGRRHPLPQLRVFHASFLTSSKHTRYADSPQGRIRLFDPAHLSFRLMHVSPCAAHAGYDRRSRSRPAAGRPAGPARA